MDSPRLVNNQRQNLEVGRAVEDVGDGGDVAAVPEGACQLQLREPWQRPAVPDEEGRFPLRGQAEGGQVGESVHKLPQPPDLVRVLGVDRLADVHGQRLDSSPVW